LTVSLSVIVPSSARAALSASSSRSIRCFAIQGSIYLAIFVYRALDDVEVTPWAAAAAATGGVADV
jgi:hypothetical protein